MCSSLNFRSVALGADSLAFHSKLSTNSKQYAIAQRLLKSYFVSLHSLLASVSSQSDIPSYAVTESANLVPWIVGNRKIARGWVKMLLGVYDSASDEVRVQAFAALRKLAIAADHSLRESIMKVRLVRNMVRGDC